MDLKEEHILGDSVREHWYYRAKAAAVLRWVRNLGARSILDVGAGSGFFSKELLRHSSAEESLCVDVSYPADSDDAVNGKRVRYRRRCDFVNADLVLMMDVLEHVDDDLGLLREYMSKVPAGTRFLISVPAFSFLWSEHDVFLGHRRRYSLRQLVGLAKSAGLEVERASYFFGFIFPLAALVRISSNMIRGSHRSPRTHLKRHSRFANAVLFLTCAAELPIFRFNRLAGLTAFCLGRRP